MNLGFEFHREAAKPKRASDDAPTQVPMRGTGTQPRRKPSADQKKVRRQMARQQRRTAASETPSKENPMSRQREAEILQAMAKADLSEQRRLAEELDAIRAQRTASVQAERDLDLADTVIRDTLTPVRVHERHTASTDWITEVPTVVEGSYDHEMRTEATLWFGNVHEAVREDREEFAEQAKGMARRMAGRYGEAAPAAAQVFLDTAVRLHRIANEDNGHAESTVTDYDTEAGQEPMWGEDWPGGDAAADGDTGVHPPMPGAGEAANSIATPTAARKTAVSLTNVGIEGDYGVGTDPEGTRVKFMLTEKEKTDLKAVLYSDLAVNFSGVDVPQSSIVTVASRTAAEGQTCSVCGDKIAKDPSGEEPSTWHHDNGEKHDHEAKPSGEAKQSSLRKRAAGPTKAIAIYPDKRVVETTVNGLDDLQGIVQGLIEPVGLSDGSTMWVNEEGLYQFTNDDVNWIAADVASLGGQPQFMLGRPPLLGPVVIVGPMDADGEDTDVTDAARNWVKRVAREAGGKMSVRKQADGPTHTFPCKDCGTTVERWRGEYDVNCPSCGAPHNAGGQRLRDDYAGNPSMYDDNIGDLEGFEMQHYRDASKQAAMQVTAARPIHQIADEIRKEWGGQNVNYAAKPYLDAMLHLDDINGSFYEDPAWMVVSYFLSNAGSFRGGRAKELKDELREMVKNRKKSSVEAGGRGNDFSISDAKNEDGEWTMSPEQIRAEMNAGQDAPDPDDFYDDDRYASRSASTANPHGPVDDDQDGAANSSLPDVEVGSEGDRPMWPWELAEGDPLTGQDAAQGGTPTPSAESGYPQPKKSSREVPIPAQGRTADFRSRVQSGLANLDYTR